ncbi:MAG: branched-chain amino acid ABC transporter permease [Candidatus Dormibacteraeota bacterium]|nr:branched-chain amino acid ABC transporter permease [Candidatus Dormibacteraeota bacterium]
MTDITHAFGFGMVTAAILAIATVAVTLQYSVTQVPNFAQGDIMTLGAYAAYQMQIFVPNLILEAIAAVVVCALFSLGMNYGLIQGFQKRGTRNIIILVVTAAVSLILQNAILAAYGGAPVNLKFPATEPVAAGPFKWTQRDIEIMVSAVLVMASVHVILRYTKFGKSQRAVSDDPQLARVSGIDSERVINLTWLWAGAMTGFAGFVLASSIGAFDPSFGFSFLLVILAAAVVGGIGQAYGAMLGALLIGVAMEVGAVYISSEYKQVVAFSLLILALLLRPSGLIAARAKNVVY